MENVCWLHLKIWQFSGYEVTTWLYLQGSGCWIKMYYSFSAFISQRLWSVFVRVVPVTKLTLVLRVMKLKNIRC